MDGGSASRSAVTRLVLNSRILTGQVRHRRYHPRGYEFSHRTAMYFIDLAEWDALDQLSHCLGTHSRAAVRFVRSDYFNPSHGDLQSAVAQRVFNETGWRPDGLVFLMTQPRYFGYVFNPVSFYYCYRHGESPWTGHSPAVILAEITNTPWGERHAYCLDARAQVGQRQRFEFDKQFHVSPFNPMDLRYDWRFHQRDDQLRVHMILQRKADDAQTGQCEFDCTMVMRAEAITPAAVRRTLIHYPLATVKIISLIHWHALRLWLKGVPFHVHPNKQPAPNDATP